MTSVNRVFVVDDDPSARKGLVRLLLAAGLDVSDFASAKEFLDAFDRETSGCLVLDVRMPGMSGEDLHAELKTRDVHLPIIVVTGDDDLKTRRKAQKMEAEGFFRKPVDGKALLDAVNWALRMDKSGAQ